MGGGTTEEAQRGKLGMTIKRGLNSAVRTKLVPSRRTAVREDKEAKVEPRAVLYSRRFVEEARRAGCM